MTALPAPRSANTGFFRSLFDASFDEFITPSMVAVLYYVLMVVIGLATIAGTIGGLVEGTPLAVLVPIFGVLALIFTRMVLETTMVFFNMARDIRALAQRPADPSGPHLPA